MKLYILRAYPDEHKMHADSWIVGIFTNRAKLIHAVREHAAELGLFDFKGWEYHFTHSGHFFSADADFHTGEIEIVDANTCFEEGELS